MPLPTPRPREVYKKFASRFLKNKEVKRKFPDIKQRFAVMSSTWRNR